MKNLLAATLFLTVIFISIPCGTSYRGACSSRLMDKLLEVCGPRGIKSVRKFFILYRYHNRLSRRRRVGKRSIPDYEPPFDKYLSTFQVERMARSEMSASLSAIVEAGAIINQRREQHSRVRRQISRDCCLGRCSDTYILKAYCKSGR